MKNNLEKHKKLRTIKPTLKDWRSLVIPKSKIPTGADPQKILREIRYGK